MNFSHFTEELHSIQELWCNVRGMECSEKYVRHFHVLAQNYFIKITKPWKYLNQIWILQLVKAIIVESADLWRVWIYSELIWIHFQDWIVVESSLN